MIFSGFKANIVIVNNNITPRDVTAWYCEPINDALGNFLSIPAMKVMY